MQKMPDAEMIERGLASIRRARLVFVILLVGFGGLLWFTQALVRSGYAWVPVAGFAAVALAWVMFAYRPCTRCGQLFFFAGDPAKNPFLLRFGVRPFAAACQHCHLPLAANTSESQ